MKPEFERRGCKIIGLSCESVAGHELWSRDIEAVAGCAPSYPLIADTGLRIAKLFGMLPDTAGDWAAMRTAADNQTVRTVFVIGSDKAIKAMLSCPMSMGRNFDEVLRLLDSVQLTAAHHVVTPVNWRPRRGRRHPRLHAGRGGQGEVSLRLEDADAVSADRASAQGLRRPRSGEVAVKMP